MYLRYCGKILDHVLCLCEEIGFEYRSSSMKIKSHNLKSMLEKSMKLCSMYSYIIGGMCVTKVNNLGEKLQKLEISTIAPLKGFRTALYCQC